MKLTLRRQPTTDACTLGSMFIDGTFECFTLEPAEEGVTHPAIPAGTYGVIINYSQRFGRMLPLVVGVPGRLGIRFHPGNDSEDTEGCILLGREIAAQELLHSRDAMSVFQAKLAGAIAHSDPVTLIVEDAAPVQPTILA